MTDRFPNLLIVGAMKSGTSTLYADLARHPDIFFPENKEPMGYAAMTSSDAAGIRAFAALYRDRPERYLGDASTGYTKVPLRPSVAATVARSVIDPKIIYIARDPVTRAERHLAHNIGNGVTDPELLDIRKNVEYSCVSAYRMQISYWRAHLPPDAIFETTLEAYQADRDAVIAQALAFLELDPKGLDRLSPKDINRGAARRSAYRSPLRHVLHSPLYGRFRERVPPTLRRSLARRLLPPADQSEVCFSNADRAFLLHAIAALDALDAPAPEKIRKIFSEVAAQTESE